MIKNLIASSMVVGAFPLDRGLEKLVESGITEFELCNAGTAAGAEKHFTVNELNDKEIVRIENIIKASGAKLYAINIGGTFDIDKTEYLYALGKELGCKIITHEAGYPKEDISRDELIQKHTELNVKYADFGDKYGITTSIEAPHKKSLAETDEQIAKYWSLQDKRLKCTFDCAHMGFAGLNPIEQFKVYAPIVAHCHIRDAIKGNSLMRYGEGDIDFGKYISQTKELGYIGKYSMEYIAENEEDSIERLKSSIEYLSQFNI